MRVGLGFVGDLARLGKGQILHQDCCWVGFLLDLSGRGAGLELICARCLALGLL